MIMKKKIILLVTFMLLAMSTKAQEYNFRDYFFPFGFRTCVRDSVGNLLPITQYSFSSTNFDNYLVAETYIGWGIVSAKTTYRYYIEGNAIYSDVQLWQSRSKGSTHYQDEFILFAFPMENTPFKWTETVNGKKYQCTSEYVYIQFGILFKKAIKITRYNSYVLKNKKHRLIKTSYWVCGCGRVIAFTDRDGIKETSSKLYYFDHVKDIREISEEEYNMEMLKEQP